MRAHSAQSPRKLILALLASSAGLLAANSASAQAAADDATSVDEVVVTGSRVVTGERAPTPGTAVSSEQLQASAPANIAHTLDQMPSFQNTYSSHHGGNGSTGGDFLNLRNLGANRTLVLLDGRRFQSGNVSSIPQGLIRQIDIVTGGASAAYGSDAVAGVVNFVLDTKFEGLKGQMQAGGTQYADGRNYMAQLSAGAAIAAATSWSTWNTPSPSGSLAIRRVIIRRGNG